MQRLCIVGSGLTGAVTAWLLKQTMPQLRIVILEKARGTGGRMCTSRSSLGSSLDLGAQFISKTASLSDIHKQCYNELLKAGLLQPLNETVDGLISRPMITDDYVCPNGTGSIVKHFLQLAGCEILFQHKVTKISPSDNKWQVTCDNNSNVEFDAVILTVPVPQILQIEGATLQVENEELENLKAVRYSSRFALGLYYDSDTKAFDTVSWAAKYISDDDVLRFCSLDFRKRCSLSSLPTVVVHTTKEYGRAYIDHSDLSVVQTTILNKLKEKVLSNIPEPADIKFHKWRYSQVEKKYVGEPGSLVVSKSPLLIFGGDGFSQSTFEGCINSASSIAKNIIEIIK